MNTTNTNIIEVFLNFFVILLTVLIILSTFPISFIYCLKVVKEYEKGVILRFGKMKYQEPIEAGLYFVLPKVDVLHKIDTRIKIIKLSLENIICNDSELALIDVIIFIKIVDPISVLFNVSDFIHSTEFITQSTILDVLSTTSLHDVLYSKNKLTEIIQNISTKITINYGVVIENVEFINVNLTPSTEKVLAFEREITSQTYGKIKSAESERETAILLKDASKIYEDSPISLELKYLQTLTAISSKNSSTIVFPMEFLNLLKK